MANTVQANVTHTDFEGRYDPSLSEVYISRSIMPHLDRKHFGERQALVARSVAEAVGESRNRRHAHLERYLQLMGRRAFFQDPLNAAFIMRDSLATFVQDVKSIEGDLPTIHGATLSNVNVELAHETQNGAWESLCIDEMGRRLRRQRIGGSAINFTQIYGPHDRLTSYKFMILGEEERGFSLAVRRQRPVADVGHMINGHPRKIEIVKSSFFAIDPEHCEDYEMELINQAMAAGGDQAAKTLHSVAGKVVVEPAVVAFREARRISTTVIPVETTYFAMHRLAS